MNRRTLAGGIGVAALIGASFVMPATAQDTTGTVQLVHGVPGTPVDVYVDDTLVADDFQPETRSGALELEEGDHTVDIVDDEAADNSSPLYTEAISVTAGTDVDVVAHYDGDMALDISVFENNTDLTVNGQGRITLRHAGDAGGIDATVDETQLADNLTLGMEASESFDSGDRVLTIFPAGVTETPLFAGETIALAEGAEEVRYVVGSEEDETLAVIGFTRDVGENPEEPAGPATGDRLSGDFREDTAVAISQETYADGAPVVYIANRSVFADALAAKSLQDGPVLLNASCGGYTAERDADGDLLYDATAEEIERLQPESVVALGGEAAICDDVLDAAVAAANAGADS